MNTTEVLIPKPDESNFESGGALFDSAWPIPVTVSNDQSLDRSLHALDALSERFTELGDAALTIKGAIESGALTPDQENGPPSEVAEAIEKINGVIADQV